MPSQPEHQSREEKQRGFWLQLKAILPAEALGGLSLTLDTGRVSVLLLFLCWRHGVGAATDTRISVDVQSRILRCWPQCQYKVNTLNTLGFCSHFLSSASVCTKRNRSNSSNFLSILISQSRWPKHNRCISITRNIRAPIYISGSAAQIRG